MPVKVTPSSGNVFLDLGFSPEEADNLRLRAQLMIQIDRVINERGLTQSQAAELFGVSQPRVSDVIRGKIGRFTIDALVNMLAKAGVRVELKLAVLTGP